MMTAEIAKIIWFAGIVVWVAIRYPYQRRSRRMGVARATGGRLDQIALAIAAAGQFVLPLFYVATGQPAFADYALHSLQGWIGLLALAGALVMFRVTHKQLGRNWSVTLETRKEHVLVTSGLYAYVRHPMYSSFLLFAVAQLLLLPNWIAGPAGLAGLAILFFLRVDREEKLMVETFGEQYAAYMRKTARVIPWLY
jgi:protein-S-isoprenylcysteine O-methyltransferase Ste14